MPKDFISLADYSTEQLRKLVDLAHDVKRNPRAYRDACEGQTLAMIFQKPSLRTRVSFQTGIYQLGGQGIYLGPTDIQLHRGETIADTAQVLARYVDGIMARVFAHSDVVELGVHANIRSSTDFPISFTHARCWLTFKQSPKNLDGSRVSNSPTLATETTWPILFCTDAPKWA